MKTAFKKIIIAITFILAMAVATTASAAWPTTSEWIAMPDNTGTAGLNDPINDTNPGEYLDIAGDATYPSAYMYNDGDYIYFRIRLDDSPIQSDPDNLRAFGWGFVIDTDGDDLDYEWLVMIDGITDEVYLAENTTKTGIGDPSDKAETVVWS
ncbi:MAG: hypothetical protein KAS88_04865, partial [Deltaproteobacteria bacterium]|nr:hypothetical protein [Deltaproteobacteria bacterium]